MGRIPRFCSTRCRVAAHRAKKLPAEMTERDRWVRHKAKRPLTVRGAAASSTYRGTWSPYAAAKAATVGDGLGFVLGDGIGCIDLDHCLTNGKPAPWAQEILDRCPNTYIEISMSGDGLHIFGHLPEAQGRVIRDDRSIEYYSRGRYIAVTGNRWASSPSALADLSEVVATL